MVDLTPTPFITTDKHDNAIQVIQQLIICCRKMAYDKVSHDKIADLLDDIEYLPSLILSDEDKTVEFRKHIEGIAEEHNLPMILDIFDQ